jgi:hypothetical protein
VVTCQAPGRARGCRPEARPPEGHSGPGCLGGGRRQFSPWLVDVAFWFAAVTGTCGVGVGQALLVALGMSILAALVDWALPPAEGLHAERPSRS